MKAMHSAKKKKVKSPPRQLPVTAREWKSPYQRLLKLFNQQRYREIANYVERHEAAVDKSPDVANIASAALISLGRFHLALKYAFLGLQQNPVDEDLLNSLGIAMKELGNRGGALAAFETVVAINPAKKEVFCNAASVAVGMDEKLAVHYLQKALLIDQDYVPALHMTADILYKNSRFDIAAKVFKKLAGLQPNNDSFLSGWAACSFEIGDYSSAEEGFEALEKLQPGSSATITNLATTYQVKAMHEKAAEKYRLAVSQDHENLYALSQLCHQYAFLGDWEGMAWCKNLFAELKNGNKDCSAGGSALNGKLKAISPFSALSLTNDPQTLLEVATQYSKIKENQISRIRKPRRTLNDGQKIKVGYFSADFYNHATMHLISEMLQSHNREKFEIHAFSFGTAEIDLYTKVAISSVDYFHDVKEWSAAKIAEFSRQLDIDIAVDLKGFTKENRFEIFAHGAAPLQVNFLGFPGTMGSDAVDYIIADDFVIPESHERFYSEKIARMPICYQPSNGDRIFPERRTTRDDWGIPPEAKFVFGSFNASYKTTNDELEVWAKILSQCADSCLVLLDGSESWRSSVTRFLAKLGIPEDRLVFVGRVSVADHLERHHIIDLMLDSFWVNAHTTCNDAIWMGVPILSLPGDSFASRVCGSILHHCGLNDLIAASVDDYVGLATHLWSDKNYYRAVKSKVESIRLQGDFFSGRRFAGELENLYRDALNQGSP